MWSEFVTWRVRATGHTLDMKLPAQLIFCLVLVISLFGCSSSPAPAAKVKPEDKPVAMPSPSKETGDGPAESELPKALDLPLYPKAKVVRNKIAEGGAEKRYHVTLETPDSLKQVTDFYQAQGLMSAVSGEKGQSMGETKNGNSALIDMERKGGKTEIVIRVSVGAKHACSFI
jgi:hypothetical protein